VTGTDTNDAADDAAGPWVWPAEPKLSNASERQVWQDLVAQLPSGAFLLGNLRLSDRNKNHEIDALVLLPGRGAVVLEVKGSGVAWGPDGWTVMRAQHQVRADPVDQARTAMYALRNLVEHDARWGGRGRIRWAHAVVTPFTRFGPDFALPDLPRWMLHDKDDQRSLAQRLAEQLDRTEHADARRPHEGDLEMVVEILTRPRGMAVDRLAESDERAAVADQLTMEQAVLLGATRLLRRVEVRGGAGSGKTVLALQQAKDLSRGGAGRSRERVALLCYSIGLAEHLTRVVSTWGWKERPAFVGTFHDFGRQWGAPTGSRTDSAFWEEQLPAEMARLAAQLPDAQRYDSIIVDEAQDFADSWWQPVLNALRDEQTSGLYVYSDENQRLFARYGEPPVPLVPLVLDHNLRNTRQILDAFAPLAPSRMRPRGSDGPDVRFVPAAIDDALEAADDAVERLLDEGWPQQHVCLLTTGKRHPVQVERAAGDDQEAYWRTFWETDDVFYGHVLGCKGLERRVVVLCVNDDGARERARERLYVGMSRATDVLVVVGDPEVIRAVGGPEVARRLGIRESSRPDAGPADAGAAR